MLKKITGTTISDLAGLNKFKPKGDCVLSMLGLVKEPFDEFYTKRGKLAEQLAKRSLERKNHKCTTYQTYDNFPDNTFFGGAIDIELLDENTIYEIKSKNIKDFERISKFGDVCQEQQAIHYAYLRGYPYAHIMWIFFDNDTENLIRNDQPISSFKNLKMFEKTLTVDVPTQDKIHNDALNYYFNCIKNRAIPMSDISDKYLSILGVPRSNSVLKLNFSVSC